MEEFESDELIEEEEEFESDELIEEEEEFESDWIISTSGFKKDSAN